MNSIITAPTYFPIHPGCPSKGVNSLQPKRCRVYSLVQMLHVEAAPTKVKQHDFSLALKERERTEIEHRKKVWKASHPDATTLPSWLEDGNTWKPRKESTRPLSVNGNIITMGLSTLKMGITKLRKKRDAIVESYKFLLDMALDQNLRAYHIDEAK
jgi:hypothetical protein